MSKVFLKQSQTAGSIRDDRINPLEIYDKDVVKIMNNSRASFKLVHILVPFPCA